MRIDKFLKVSRVIKKRKVSKELTSFNRLYLNGRACKAHSEVHVGDIISVEFGHRTITLKVLNILPNASKEQALTMYEIVEEKCSQLDEM